VRFLVLIATLPALTVAAESSEYTAATEGAGLVYHPDPDEPDRWYVDFAGAESDWRVTVYRTPEHLFLSTVLWVEPGGVPMGMQRWALERSFDLPLFKLALDPTGTRLVLAADLRTPDTSPEAYLEVLSSLVATAEREHALARGYAAPTSGGGP
jgi:hypothetical protein